MQSALKISHAYQHTNDVPSWKKCVHRTRINYLIRQFHTPSSLFNFRSRFSPCPRASNELGLYNWELVESNFLASEPRKHVARVARFVSSSLPRFFFPPLFLLSPSSNTRRLNPLECRVPEVFLRSLACRWRGENFECTAAIISPRVIHYAFVDKLTPECREPPGTGRTLLNPPRLENFREKKKKKERRRRKS